MLPGLGQLLPENYEWHQKMLPNISGDIFDLYFVK
jgi:hypothetical protein